MRIRLRFSEHGKVRFCGHRDVARLWERAWRKAELPIEYSQGFSPHARMHFGLALSVGHESDGEYLDIDVPDTADIDLDTLADRLTPMLPGGFLVQAAIEIGRDTLSLQQAVTSCSWQIEVLGTRPADITSAVRRLVESDSVLIERTRKGKTAVDDIRTLVHVVEICGPTLSGVELIAELGTQPRALRPAEFVRALGQLAGGPSPSEQQMIEGRVCRTHQWISSGSARQEPIPLAATRTQRVEARAS
jgi:radical SAM-linked protein